MDGRSKAVMVTKADSAAMTSLLLSPRGHVLSHTKSEAVKVTRTKYKHKLRTDACTNMFVNTFLLIRHSEWVILCTAC